MKLSRFSRISQLIPFLLVFLSLGFAACSAHAGADSDKLFKSLLDSINDEKGQRKVDFLVYEPIHVSDGGPANGNSEMTGFDAETAGLQGAILATFKEVAGKRPWTPSYFSSANRDSIRNFYDGLKSYVGKEKKLAFLKETVESMNRRSSDNHFETIVYAYMNDTEVTVFVYDITKPTEFHFGRKPFSPTAGPESRRSTVKNAFHDALVNAFGEPPL